MHLIWVQRRKIVWLYFIRYFSQTYTRMQIYVDNLFFVTLSLVVVPSLIKMYDYLIHYTIWQNMYIRKIKICYILMCLRFIMTYKNIVSYILLYYIIILFCVNIIVFGKNCFCMDLKIIQLQLQITVKNDSILILLLTIHIIDHLF